VYSSIPRSITGRLVASYAVATAGILGISGVFLYGMLSLHLARERSQFLSDEIDTLVAVQQEHPESTEALREEIGFESDASHFSHYHARVLEADQLLLETPSMASILPVSAFPALPPPKRAVRGTSYAALDGKPYLLVTAEAPFRERSRKSRVLQLAVDTSSDAELMTHYRRDMGLAILVGTLSSALAGWFIARRGLRPLRDIAARARGITVSLLHERVGSARWPSELTRLAEAFDEMLGRLELSFSRLAQFSADLAHELRTPINNLMGEAEVALTRSRSSDDYRHVIESSLEEFGRLARMIDSLLFLARAENIETQLQPVLLDARAQLEAVREFYGALADERGVRVSSAGEGQLLADPILFQRAISNLLANALEHTPAGGHVTLRVQEARAELEVSVADDGCGVAEEHLPRLFDRFYRADDARSNGPGTGLGLALVKSIVELHHGSAHIESQLGHGTTVRLRFPAIASD